MYSEDALSTFAERLNDIQNEAKFFNQPFKPEMITEYFDGWSREKPSMVDYYTVKGNVRSRIILWLQNRRYTLIKELIENYPAYPQGVINKIEFMQPETLNDFIGDCIRVGIELNWKPEIAKKYFT